MNRVRASVARRVATSALNARLGTVMPMRNASTRRNDSLASGRVNGPLFHTAPQTAKPASRKATVAVSRCPERRAAHSSGRTASDASAPRLAVCSNNGLNARMPTAIVVAMIAAERSNSSRASAGRALHSTSTGVTTSAPARSPSHHVIQTAQKLAAAA